MHELSIATLLYEQVKRHTPAGSRARRARVLIGPMQGIEPESLRFGWAVLFQQDGVEAPELLLELPGWKLSCGACGRKWESAELYVSCTCGNAAPNPEGGAELQLISIDVEDEVFAGERP